MRLKANTTNDEGVTAEQEAAAALAESRTALSETASVDGDGAGDKSAKAGVSPRPTVSYVEYVDAQLPAKGRYEIVGMSQFEPWFIRLVTAVQVRCNTAFFKCFQMRIGIRFSPFQSLATPPARRSFSSWPFSASRAALTLSRSNRALWSVKLM